MKYLLIILISLSFSCSNNTEKYKLLRGIYAKEVVKYSYYQKKYLRSANQNKRKAYFDSCQMSLYSAHRIYLEMKNNEK